MASNCEPDNGLEAVDVALLPPQMRRLVQLIGLPDTLTLLRARGGTEFRIPVDPHGSLLAELIGLESAAILCREMPGQTLDLPKHDKIALQIRNQAIRNARRHQSASQVARQFGLTRRHIVNLTSDEDDEQLDMFD